MIVIILTYLCKSNHRDIVLSLEHSDYKWAKKEQLKFITTIVSWRVDISKEATKPSNRHTETIYNQGDYFEKAFIMYKYHIYFVHNISL